MEDCQDFLRTSTGAWPAVFSVLHLSDATVSLWLHFLTLLGDSNSHHVITSHTQHAMASCTPHSMLSEAIFFSIVLALSYSDL